MRFCRTSLVLAVVALAATSRPAPAEVIEVPPLVITELTHQFWTNESGVSSVNDFIAIPGTGYTSSGFTAAFGTGDVVRVRVAAPPGMKFRIGAPGPAGFHVSVHWWTDAPGGTSHFNPHTVAFENLTGTPPTQSPDAWVAANEHMVQVWVDFPVPSEIEFTAFRVDIAVDQALAKVPRAYGDAGSSTWPAIGAAYRTTDPGLTVMEIVPDSPVPSLPGTWGRLKTLFR